MSALSSFMLDRFNVSDFDSALTGSILKVWSFLSGCVGILLIVCQFVVRFETLDSEMLEMTKLSKILQRLTKKATNEINTLAQDTLKNAAAASLKKSSTALDKKSDKPASPGFIGSPADGSRKDVVAGVKRQREGDAALQPVAKKVIKVIPKSSKPLAVRLEEKRKAEEAAKRAKPGEKTGTSAATTSTGISTTNPALKAKVAVVAPPKSSIFAALSSVPKKPGTSNAERAAAAAKEKTVPIVASSSVPARSIKKESPPRNVGPTPITKSATSSSFLGVLLDMEKKPEKEVKKEVDIPNETEEQKVKRLRKESRRRLRVSWKADDNLVETRFFTHDPDEELDQGDRLKANAGGGREGEALKHKDMDDLDDEEDEDSFEELEPYTPPSEVDFAYLEDPLLGDDSPHKANSLKFGGSMKPESRSSEAQDKYEQDTLMAIYTTKAERPPTPKELDDTKEDDDFEPAEPETPFGELPEKIRQRENEYLAHRTRPQPQPSIDLNALAQAMAAQQRPQQQPAGLTPELQRALGMYNQPTTTPQAAPAANAHLQAILQSVLGQQMQNQPQQPQYPVATQAAATYAPNNLGALLASVQQGAQNAPATTALPVGMGGNPNPFPGGFEDASRKHARNDSNGNDEDYSKKGGNKKKKGESKPYNYKTQVCSFWEQGKCLKGDSCTYRHGAED